MNSLPLSPVALLSLRDVAEKTAAYKHCSAKQTFFGLYIALTSMKIHQFKHSR